MLAKIENGKIIYNDIQEAGLILESLEGKEVEVIIKRKKKNRSNNQNSYYWGVIVPAYQEGHRKHCIELLKQDLSRDIIDFILSNIEISKERAHEALKSNFNEYLEAEAQTKIKSTSNLSTLEFEYYLEYCRFFIGENYGIEVELPNE